MAATAQTSTIAIEPNLQNPGWLRNSVFDFHFIVSIAVLALATGSCALIRPDLFQLFILLDVWLLGYHHVVSTFTRLVFDRSSFQENRFLVIHLPIIVVACTLAAIWLLGTWVIATTYLYWQWFHYTRQSYGVERMYRRKAGDDVAVDDYVATRALYMLPLFGIFYRSWQQPDEFIGMDVFAFTVPFPLLVGVGIVTALALSVWGAQQISAYRQGRLATAHCRYMLSHFVIFLFGYVLISDITAGWLVINIWHNFQYILFVWWFNNKRFEKGIDPKSRFLSTISQRENMLIYMGLCLSISTVVYVALTGATTAYRTSTVSVTVIVLMMLNFHHYVVDGIIWKRKRTKAKPIAAATAGA